MMRDKIALLLYHINVSKIQTLTWAMVTGYRIYTVSLTRKALLE